jgi:hypothetical protein
MGIRSTCMDCSFIHLANATYAGSAVRIDRLAWCAREPLRAASDPFCAFGYIRHCDVIPCVTVEFGVDGWMTRISF